MLVASKTAGKVETRIQLVDFAKNDPAALDAFKSVVNGLEIGVLGEYFPLSLSPTEVTLMAVNNVGKSHAMPTYFAETSEQEMDDIVTINVSGTVRVTRAVLPGMIQRSVVPLFSISHTTDKRVDCSKRGLILNLGSFAGQVASPMLATYSGTKAFVSTFTSALAEEVRPHNISVQHLNTYFVVCVPLCCSSPAPHSYDSRSRRCPKSRDHRRWCPHPRPTFAPL